MVPKRLNHKTFSKKETEEIISNRAVFEPTLTEVFTSYVATPKVYRLPDDTFLYVYGSIGSNGKSDKYSKEVFEQWILSAKADKRYSVDLKITDSYRWFLYFSNYKADLISKIDSSIEHLTNVLSLQPFDLNFTLQSLDVLSVKVLQLGIENYENKIVDGIVAYTGEIIRKEIEGQWRLNDLLVPAIYNEISSYGQLNWYSPINQVWDAFRDPANFPIKKVLSAEIAKFRRNMGKVKTRTTLSETQNL